MKTAKLVTGILSIVLSFFVLFQSCAAGMYNAMSANGEVSGSAGFVVALLMIAGGIVGIATRNSQGKGGSIAATILYGLAFLLGATNAGSYGDLVIWSALCLILAMMYLISAIRTKKKARRRRPRRSEDDYE
ncbi:hypothetical protein D3Z48_06075 [Clostridiaceae bacterium]|nr:hypothetical protein [Clostridiaceae bacterium]